MHREQALVAIATFDTVAEANVVQALLEADGIRVHASNSGLIGLDWSFSQAVGGIRLMVPGERAVEAAALIDAYRRGDLATMSEAGDVPAPQGCPRCGSPRIAVGGALSEKGLLVLLTALFGAMFPVSNRKRACRDCHHRWCADETTPVDPGATVSM